MQRFKAIFLTLSPLYYLFTCAIEGTDNYFFMSVAVYTCIQIYTTVALIVSCFSLLSLLCHMRYICAHLGYVIVR